MSQSFVSEDIPVRPEWIDYNGHVTDYAYSIICSEANERFAEHLGLGAAYVERTGCTFYTVESHLRFLSEAKADDVLHGESFIVSSDAKRLQIHTTVLAGNRPILTGEYLYLHYDQNAGRVAPFPDELRARIESVKEEQAGVERPRHLGRGVGQRG